jgi:hypothetical protein
MVVVVLLKTGRDKAILVDAILRVVYIRAISG